MNCCVCYKTRIKPDGSPGGADCPGVCDPCGVDAALGRAVRENKRKIRRAFHDTGHRCDATAICQGIVDMIEAKEGK